AQVDALLGRQDADGDTRKLWATNRARRLVALRRVGAGSESGAPDAGDHAQTRPVPSDEELREAADRLAAVAVDARRAGGEALGVDPRDLVVFGDKPAEYYEQDENGVLSARNLSGEYADYASNLSEFVSVAVRANLQADDLLTVLDVAYRTEG